MDHSFVDEEFYRSNEQINEAFHETLKFILPDFVENEEFVPQNSNNYLKLIKNVNYASPDIANVDGTLGSNSLCSKEINEIPQISDDFVLPEISNMLKNYSFEINTSSPNVNSFQCNNSSQKYLDLPLCEADNLLLGKIKTEEAFLESHSEIESKPSFAVKNLVFNEVCEDYHNENEQDVGDDVHQEIKPSLSKLLSSLKRKPLVQIDKLKLPNNIQTFKIKELKDGSNKLSTNDILIKQCGETILLTPVLQKNTKYCDNLTADIYKVESKKLGSSFTKTESKLKQLIHNRFKQDNLSPSSKARTGKSNNSCKLCGKFFRSIEDLRTHYVSHAKKKGFVCKICHISFKKMTLLKKHESHLHAGQRVKCYKCGNLFNPLFLNTHRMYCKVNTCDFKCIICDKRFKKGGNLSKHLQTHKGISNHKCFTCEKIFETTYDLKCHIALHGPFQFASCN